MRNVAQFEFMTVAEKTVEFEDGHTTRVSPFQIATKCVTVRQFLAFQDAAGYRTTSFSVQGRDVYRDNEILYYMSPEERMDECAFCISYDDAMAFCRWNNVRLPTEDEWLAAALFDETIYEPYEPTPDGGFKRGPCPWRDSEGTLIASKIEACTKFIASGGREWTATSAKGGRFITRSGPIYFRDSDWKDHPGKFYRVCMPDECDLMNCFRICHV